MHPILTPLAPSDLQKAISYVQAYFEHDGLEFGPHVESGITQLLANPTLGTFHEIIVNQKSAGYIVMTFGFDHEFGGRLGLVTDFYLFEEYRGAGTGTKVLHMIQEEAKRLGLHAIELDVLRHNSRGMDFYRANGFGLVQDRHAMVKLIPN